jgi:hypothetical protein
LDSLTGAASIAGIFPRGPGQVIKLRRQIKAYVSGQLDACTQPDPENPKALFRVSAPAVPVLPKQGCRARVLSYSSI